MRENESENERGGEGGRGEKREGKGKGGKREEKRELRIFYLNMPRICKFSCGLWYAS